MTRFDVIIVGAGPAGSAAAIGLARTGASVLLIDKDRFPREKACGDGLTRRAVSALQRLGLESRFGEAPRIHGLRVVEHRAGRERLYLHDQLAKGADYGMIVPRIELDQILVEAAQEAGAEFWQESAVDRLRQDSQGRIIGVSVKRAERHLELDASFVIVAEGSSGRLSTPLRRSSLGKADRSFAVRQYARVRNELDPYFEVHFPVTDGIIPVPGYGWVFPMANGHINLGAGIGYGRGFNQKVSVRRLYERFLDLLDQSGRYEDLEPCSPLIGSSLRQGLIPEECISPGLVLAGDAASLVNPFTGEGIAYALESGESASEAIASALAAGTTTALRYPELLHTHLRRHVHLRQEIPDLVGLFRTYNWFVAPNHESNSEKKHPRILVSESIGRMLGDDERYEDAVLRPNLWRGVLSDSSESQCVEIEERVLEAAGRIRPSLGEIAYYMRNGLWGSPGIPSRLLLLAAGKAPRERIAKFATIAEMVELSLSFHSDIARAEEKSQVGDERSAQIDLAPGLLLGDAMAATTFELLNDVEPGRAAKLSDTIVAHHELWMTRTLLPHMNFRSQPGQLDREEGAGRFLSALVDQLLSDAEIDEEEKRARVAYTEKVSMAFGILYEVWIDYYGHGLASPSERLSLLRRGLVGRHAQHALAHDVDPWLERDGQTKIKQEADWRALQHRLIDTGATEATLLEGRSGLIDAAEKLHDWSPADAQGAAQLLANGTAAFDKLRHSVGTGPPFAGF